MHCFTDYILPKDFNLDQHLCLLGIKPAQADKCIHGLEEAKERAQVISLNNAVKAIRNGWKDGPAECYQDAARKAGLESALESSILNWDIKVCF